jgi:hypothetical protein
VGLRETPLAPAFLDLHLPQPILHLLPNLPGQKVAPRRQQFCSFLHMQFSMIINVNNENKTQKEKANCAPLIYQSFCCNA